jgi:hypothetical protein
LWAGLKAAGDDFPNFQGSDPTGDVSDGVRNKEVQGAVVGTFYMAANSTQVLTPALDLAADFGPIVEEVFLTYQIIGALGEGGKAYKESIDQCYGTP